MLAQTVAGPFALHYLPADLAENSIQTFTDMKNTVLDQLPALPSGTGLEILGLDVDGTRKVLSAGGWKTNISFVSKSRSEVEVDTANMLGDITLVRDDAYFGVEVGSYSTSQFENPLYLLILSLSSGKVLDFERISQGSEDSANQVTQFAVNRGRVYQLVVNEDGVEVRRRPNARP